MAANAVVTIAGAILSTPTGGRVIGPVNITSATASGSVQQVVLQSGDNTIAVPASPAPSGCLVVLPSTNTSVTTLKGIAADTGIALGKTTKQLLNWDPTAVPASFVLSSVSTQTGLVTEIIFF